MKKLLSKIYNSCIRGNNLEDIVGFIAFIGIFGALTASILAWKFGLSGLAIFCFILFIISVITQFLNYCGYFDFREGQGIGIYRDVLERFYSTPKKDDNCRKLIFPLSIRKQSRNKEIRYSGLPDNIVDILNLEIRPALVELYKNADFSKETRDIYKMAIPQMEKLYNSIDGSIKAMNDRDPFISESAKEDFIRSKDEILDYIRFIQEPIDKIVNFHRDMKRAEYELSEGYGHFAYIKNMNSLEKKDVDLLSDKYENADNILLQKREV